MIDNCKINFILYFILNWQFFITQVTTIIYNFYRELYQIYVLLLLYPDKSLYENAEKPQRYPTLCHWEKREFFFFCKNGKNGVMFCLFDSRTCLESFATQWTIPLFSCGFSLCAKETCVQGCDRSVQFACRIPSGGLLKCLHFLGAASHLSKLDPLFSRIPQQVLKSLIRNNFSFHI